jgi:hypothetical protein
VFALSADRPLIAPLQASCRGAANRRLGPERQFGPHMPSVRFALITDILPRCREPPLTPLPSHRTASPSIVAEVARSAPTTFRNVRARSAARGSQPPNAGDEVAFPMLAKATHFFLLVRVASKPLIPPKTSTRWLDRLCSNLTVGAPSNLPQITGMRCRLMSFRIGPTAGTRAWQNSDSLRTSPMCMGKPTRTCPMTKWKAG